MKPHIAYIDRSQKVYSPPYFGSFFGTVKCMKTFFRRRYILARLRRKALIDVAIGNIADIGNGNKRFVFKSTFLNHTADRYFFGLKRSNKSKMKRMYKDEQIIEACTNSVPLLIEQRTAMEAGVWSLEHEHLMPEISAGTPLIRSTGDGDEFSGWINFIFVHLLTQYTGLWAIIVALVGYAWAPLIVPHLFPLACKYLVEFHLCSPFF